MTLIRRYTPAPRGKKAHESGAQTEKKHSIIKLPPTFLPHFQFMRVKICNFAARWIFLGHALRCEYARVKLGAFGAFSLAPIAFGVNTPLLNSAQANWQSGRFMAGGHMRGDGMVSRRSRGRKIQASHDRQEGRARSVGFQLSDITGVVVLVCGCCPGGIFSNSMALAIHGDMNLSIVMTSCSTMLALGMMPLLLFIYCQGFPSVRNAVPYGEIMLSLVLILVPCSVGIGIKTYRPQYSKRFTKVGMIIMLMFLVGTLILIGVGSGHIILTMMSPSLFAIAGFMPLIGYCFGYVFSSIFRLIHRERRTVSMETGCQNVPLCTTILKVAFPEDVVGPLYLFPTVYLVFQLLEAAIIIVLFRCYQRFKRNEEETYQAAATGGDLKESDV
ncbi:sodium/bile acid cotransporter isoform X1 [Oreochromis niloticus]|uniref:sodium/bile acid cotransporter isoform X1 n=1 Tax=Oreochromis niloticus TaxID=8128 RepID=UPI000DF23E81|nr:sodium/bile acid cotransporter isoform X1 [Oreochromis niloticus]CAI5684146.1 unnamed protein product [Mustela putorius furo]